MFRRVRFLELAALTVCAAAMLQAWMTPRQLSANESKNVTGATGWLQICMAESSCICSLPAIGGAGGATCSPCGGVAGTPCYRCEFNLVNKTCHVITWTYACGENTAPPCGMMTVDGQCDGVGAGNCIVPFGAKFYVICGGTNCY